MCETVTKCKPMLFSGPMVTACLREEHPKTQTRRLVKIEHMIPGARTVRWENLTAEAIVRCFRCPYGAPGDVLLIKESHRLEKVKVGRWLRGVKCIFEADGVCHAWTLDDLPAHVVKKLRKYRNWGRLRTGRFLFACMIRERLEVVSVRAERVQDISDEDAIAEGVEAYPAVAHIHGPPSVWVKRYAALWESINGKGSWAKNPWVWVITFKHCKAMEASR